MHVVLMYNSILSEIIECTNTAYHRHAQFHIQWCAILGNVCSNASVCGILQVSQLACQNRMLYNKKCHAESILTVVMKTRIVIHEGTAILMQHCMAGCVLQNVAIMLYQW